MHLHSIRRRGGFRLTALAAALGLSIGAIAPVMAQSTTGAIFGQAPAAAAGSVTVTSDTGFTRDVPVDAEGRYRIGNLPLGQLQRQPQARRRRGRFA